LAGLGTVMDRASVIVTEALVDVLVRYLLLSDPPLGLCLLGLVNWAICYLADVR
jgi:hypothetical protein